MDKAIFETAHLAALNDQQRAAVEAVNGPVLLLAVPGSGKTTVLITRLGYMTEVCGIAPEAILTMTYTVAATQEMRVISSRAFWSWPHGQEWRMKTRSFQGAPPSSIWLGAEEVAEMPMPKVARMRAISAMTPGWSTTWKRT